MAKLEKVRRVETSKTERFVVKKSHLWDGGDKGVWGE